MPPAEKRDTAAKRWCFTLNNPTEQEVQTATRFCEAEFHFAIVGREVGQCGTPHLQGFLHFRSKKRLSALKKIFQRAHWEKARGSDAENKEYCSKEGNVLTMVGHPCGSNTTSDLAEAVAAVHAGRRMIEIARDFSEAYVKYGAGLHRLHLLIGNRPRDFKTEVTVLWGPPGKGKSRWAAELPGDKYYKMKGDWWDGYTGEEIVVIDDFYGWLPYCELLRLMDRYPHKVPFKGGYMEFTSKHIVITSNSPPMDWYKSIENKAAMYRRFTRVLTWYPETMFGYPGLRNESWTTLPYPINY